MVTYCVRRCLLSARRLLVPRAAQRSPLTLGSSPACHSWRGRSSAAYQLGGRGLVRVSGRDTVDLLQGLVTSDVTQLVDGSHRHRAQYCMMLNVQGRVLFDLILYNTTQSLDTACFLVECDATLTQDFIATVKRYRIRKKVDIAEVSEEYQVWASPSDLDPTQPLRDPQREEGARDEASAEVSNVVINVPDPRVPLFGQRLIFRTGEESVHSLSGGDDAYTSLRYRWGIPEGATDLPPGNCLPLESNLTIMNGVSFLKGCYIGQELTARTHHTGVVRKRLLPLVFDSPPSSVERDAPIVTDKGRNAGKVRGIVGQRGLGLVRLEHDNKPLSTTAHDGQKLSLSTYRPQWWPDELLH